MLVNLNKVRDIFLIWISIPKRDYFCSMFILTTQIHNLSLHNGVPELQFWTPPFNPSKVHSLSFSFLRNWPNPKKVASNTSFILLDFLCFLDLGPVILHCFDSPPMPSNVCFKKYFIKLLWFLVKTLLQITYATIIGNKI